MDAANSLINKCKEIKLFETKEKKLYFILGAVVISPSEGAVNYLDLNNHSAREEHRGLIEALDKLRPINYKQLFSSEFGAQSIFSVLLDEAIEKSLPLMRKKALEIDAIYTGMRTSMKRMFSEYFKGMSEEDIRSRMNEFRYKDTNYQPEHLIEMIESGTAKKQGENTLFLSVGSDSPINNGRAFSMYVKPNEEFYRFVRAFSIYQYDISQVMINIDTKGGQTHATMRYQSLFGGTSMTAVNDDIMSALEIKAEELKEVPAKVEEVVEIPANSMRAKYGYAM